MEINLRDLPVINFPDGHKHLQLKEDYDSDTICISIKSFDDLFLLAQAKQIITTLKYLRINYLLGARCDRRFSMGEALDLKIISSFINGLGFKRVEIVKSHSDVSLALIDNSIYDNQYTSMLFKYCVTKNDVSEYSIISPDAGASKWIEKELGTSDVIQCNKDRDMATGEINGISFSGAPKTDCIIVDDLCDGGRTFIELAKSLRAKGANRIFLVITHGIFSKGFRVFDGLIDGIFCTDSFSLFEDNLLTQISV